MLSVSAWHPDRALTDRLASAWGLDPLEIPDALEFVQARLLADNGHLELARVKQRAATDQYVYRWTEATQGPATLTVERPVGWDRAHERRAMEDMRYAWTHGRPTRRRPA